MPEKFGFACFLERLATSDPYPVIEATAALFCEHLGQAIELNLLDWNTGAQVRKPWCNTDQLFRTWPGPTQFLFVYFRGPNEGRPCISFAGTAVAAEMTVAMEDMALASSANEIADLCMRFYTVCNTFAAESVVAAGGEIEFSTKPQTAKQALNEVTAPLSLAQWIVCPHHVSTPIAQRFAEVRRSRTATLMKAY